ncbi:lysozyme [Xylophilus sp.]|uniref:lysozyme n=1 Tax=Xylophilus sp. TaxID=2653893 RepID=UPI0013B8F96A|nr:lysozyme [Xylophilus sp.]KAF1045620.1 MAG: Lysozyme RrrD [Xylophilus sp.]
MAYAEGVGMKGRVAAAIVALAMSIAGGLVANFEGTRYAAYPDPSTKGAPWTICEGHTQGVKAGDVATRAQCDEYLRQDLAAANDAIDRCIVTPLGVNQRAALISAVVNAGPPLVCGSTLQRKANAGDLAGMCAELSRWTWAAGRQLPGLVRRRAEERALCEKSA